MRPQIVQWLDAMGSCTTDFDEEAEALYVRGVPCRDFHHRGFDVVRRKDQFLVKSPLGVELAAAETMDDAICAGVFEVSGLDISEAMPPTLRPVPPRSARICRDWTFHVACYERPAELRAERIDLLQATVDAVATGTLAGLESRTGAGAHHLVAGLALELLQEPPTPALAGARVLEVDWLKLTACQTATNALGPGEGLAEALEAMLTYGHVPVIPRGRVGELVRVMSPDLYGVVLCSRPGECLAISLVGRVVRIRVPEADDHLLRGILTDEARRLEAELDVTISAEAVEYVLSSGVKCVEQDIGPLAFIEMPGALKSLLRMGCRRAMALAGIGADLGRRPVVTPTDLALGLVNLGVPEDTAIGPEFSRVTGAGRGD